MDNVEHAINKLMRDLEGNESGLEALETICKELRGSGQNSAELEQAKTLLKEAVNCKSNGPEKGICPQCKDAITEFLKPNSLPSGETNTTKEATETPWPCKFSDSLVCAAKSCSDTNCDIYEPA